MTAPKHTEPLSAYAPELLALLLKGARGRVDLRFDKLSESPTPFTRARSLQRRLYGLRATMHKEKHAMWPLTKRAKVVILFGKKAGLEEPKTKKIRGGEPIPVEPCIVILRIEPRDEEFADIFRQAGITTNLTFEESTVEEVQSDPHLPRLDPNDPDFLKDFLGDSQEAEKNS